MNAITYEMLESFSKEFHAQEKNEVAMRAVMKSGLSAAAENMQEQIDNPMTFSIEIETGKITNQKSSGRCWLFAALNCMRFQIMKNLNLETFELSQNYQMFWDKMEKANYFLESILETADEDVSSRLVSHLLSSPEGDGGQWDMYCAIADKYGCVPKSAMPETFQSSNTGMMVKLVTLKLREDAMLLRAGVNVQNPAQGAEEMRGYSLRDLAIECMARDGVGTTTSLLRMSKDDLWNEACRQFFNPTAAFPAILDNAIRKNIVQMYQEIPTTFQLWTTKGSVSDFKPTKDHSYLAGGAGEFLRVGENGELKADTPKTELLPQRQIDTFGRQFSMTRQAFINDDVGFITEMPGLYAMSAKRTINKQVYKILIDNPAIFDGVSLFDNAHNNLIASGAAPSIDTLQAAMLKLLHQKDPFGDSIMVEPKYVIVPVGYGFKLAQILETAQIDVTGIGSHTANALYQYRNKLQVIEEGALNVLAGDGNAIPWFVAGDQRYAKSLQVDYLNGQETPTIRRMEVAGQLGYVWDIWLDWGITAVDFRGIAKNPGTTI